MPLDPGTRLGTYEILTLLGAGGMGEVYRARDTTLDRDVALKVLPEAFAADPDRLARFDREAKTLASLNHPNIAQVYGFETRSGVVFGAARPNTTPAVVTFLVMELIDGEDLSAHISRGPMALADALQVARQIVDALEAAHEGGIIHRDLKPANIKVRGDGTVKVLDFGLAKARAENRDSSTGGLSDSPTVTAPHSEPGVILGTAAYMSPEQARGRVVDKRTDIWAFGCVLYEMLTGARAFAGENLPDVLAAVVKREVDWSRLPGHTAGSLTTLLERCLEPDPTLRLRDIGEARVALAAIEHAGASHPSLLSGRGSGKRMPLPWIAAALAIVAAVSFGLYRWLGGSSTVTGVVARLSILPPAGRVMNPDSSNTALSPDGRMVAFVVGAGVSSENQLWVRELDSAVARRIESGDGVSLPFWSPDSTRIGFFANRKLKIVPAADGPAQVLCDTPFGRGGAFNSANVIVFAPDANGPLFKVSADGGVPVAVTTLDASRHETGHRFPMFLPDDDHFLYATLPGTNGEHEIFAGSLKDPRVRTRIGSMETAPAYSAPGWLLFTRQGLLLAQAFNPATLKTTGSVVSLGDEPRAAPGTAAYDAGRRVTASTDGSLAFIPDPAINTRVEWMDSSGKSTGSVTVPTGRYVAVSVAPDGTRAVLVRREGDASRSLWLVDLAQSSAVPFGKTVPGVPAPVWSPDGQRVAYAEIDAGSGLRQLSEKNVGDSSARKVRALTANGAYPRDWAAGDILINQIDPGTEWNVYRLPDSGALDPIPVIRGPAIEVGGWLRPDGRWIVYLSDETGRVDLFVQPYPGGGPRAHIPAGGAHLVWWNREGRELLYVTRDQTLWRATADLTPARPPRIGPPEQLGTFPSSLISMDFAARRQRFLALLPERAAIDAITVVQNWRSAAAR